jgi:hypothetical protein
MPVWLGNTAFFLKFAGLLFADRDTKEICGFAIVYTKEGTRVPSLNTGGLVYTRCTKQGVGGKCL